MNCCNDFGQCTCSAGDSKATPAPGALAPLRFAPGVIDDGSDSEFMEAIAQRQRKAIARKLIRGAMFLFIFWISAYTVGYQVG